MEAVIFVGVQGAGKTTYYTEHLFHTHVRISRDMLRTREREAILIRACIQSKQSYAVDNTNATAAARAGYIAAAKTIGFRVVAVYFEVSMRTAIGRNNHRTDKKPIPVPAIIRTLKQIEPPMLDEGFDEIQRTIEDPQ